jgi:hypothetical protein
MKRSTILIACLAGTLSLAPNAHATGEKRSPHAVTFAHKHNVRRLAERQIEQKPELTGVIPRAVRGGNILQMLNPFAPAKYGTAEENVVFAPEKPDQGDGIRLLSTSF